jgi:hypothetical protein
VGQRGFLLDLQNNLLTNKHRQLGEPQCRCPNLDIPMFGIERSNYNIIGNEAGLSD